MTVATQSMRLTPHTINAFETQTQTIAVPAGKLLPSCGACDGRRAPAGCGASPTSAAGPLRSRVAIPLRTLKAARPRAGGGDEGAPGIVLLGQVPLGASASRSRWLMNIWKQE